MAGVVKTHAAGLAGGHAVKRGGDAADVFAGDYDFKEAGVFPKVGFRVAQYKHKLVKAAADKRGYLAVDRRAAQLALGFQRGGARNG